MATPLKVVRKNENNLVKDETPKNKTKQKHKKQFRRKNTKKESCKRYFGSRTLKYTYLNNFDILTIIIAASMVAEVSRSWAG